jgi:linearmycin/streptolysin S transport system permease protein
MKVFAIAVSNLRRMFRDRTNLFFAFVFPMLLILVLGAAFGGSSNARIGVVANGSGDLTAALVDQLSNTPRVDVVELANADTLRTEVQRGIVSAGLIVPNGYDRELRSGDRVSVAYLARPGTTSEQLIETVRGAVAKQAALIGAARFATSESAVPGFDVGLTIARRLVSAIPRVSVTQTIAGQASSSATLGRFDEGAWTELLLFVFLISLSGAVALIETRRIGVSRRMLSTPTAPATVIAGETLGRVLVSLVQAAIIVGGSALFFGVRWGQPLGVLSVVLLFSLVGAGAGIFLGTLFANEQQAIGVSLLFGMGLGALGGCMVPLEVFSPTMRRIAHFTPHAWGNDAFAKLVGDGASLAAILPQLAVLAAFAVVLLALATWRLRRVLVA